jgi:hypothetical protein
MIILGTVVVLVLGGTTYVLASRPNAYEKASTDCKATVGVDVTDGGSTLLIHAGKAKNQATVETAACILNSLDVTMAVLEHIDTTRALDGRQEDTWGNHKASWTYHPDSGLRLTVTKK